MPKTIIAYIECLFYQGRLEVGDTCTARILRALQDACGIQAIYALEGSEQ